MAPPPSSGLRPNLWLAWPSDRPGPGRRDPDHPVFPDRDRTVDKIVALVAQAADRARASSRPTSSASPSNRPAANGPPHILRPPDASQLPAIHPSLINPDTNGAHELGSPLDRSSALRPFPAGRSA